MAVTCRQITELESCKKMTLLAGKNAIEREVSWPYIKTVDDLSEWLHGKEMIFVLGTPGICEEENLTNLLLEAKRADVTAVVLLTDSDHIYKVTKQVVNLANNLNIVLYKLPFRQKLIDITKEISKLIMVDSMQENRDSFSEKENCMSLMLQNASQDRLLFYCFRKLQPLIDTDKVSGCELVKTLYTFLYCGSDLLHASRELYIHRNTMIGRMKKLGRLLGEDVSDPLIRTDYIEIFEILKRFDLFDTVVK